jgi:hypothetical protein
MTPYLNERERKSIERRLGVYVRGLTSLSATQYGLTHRVFANKGHPSWREAFLALLESILRDAEDMMLTIDYVNIRSYIGIHSHFLDEVTQPRLVCMDACDPNNVLIDERTRQVTGLVGFSNVIWGDPLICERITNASEAFKEGYGTYPQANGVKARRLMYTAYRATVDIVTHSYRSYQSIDELEARRSLTRAINELAQMPR